MKSLKKSVVFLVVLTIILSTVAPVFAATPTDVAGTDYEEAVGKLVTLGVIAGYEDGTFQPEKNITRAEFAKIACYVVGVKDAADLSKGTTKFSDVPATHWASGFINIASEKGMLKGYPDGTFKPEANVTYAEAITILVRALGMGPVCEGKGSWPANYLSRASAAGVTEDVEGLASTGSAVRGVIAQLAWNTLTSEMWGEKEYTVDGIVYAPLGKQLIKSVYGDYSYAKDDKYYAKEFSGVRVIGTQAAGGLQNNQITLKTDDNANLKAYVNADSKTFKVVDAVKAEVNLNSLFGKKVDILLGKDDKIAYIKAATSDVLEGIVPAADYDTDEDTITVSDKEYYLKNDAKLYVNGSLYCAHSVDPDGDAVANYASIGAAFDAMATAFGGSATHMTAVLDSGRILYASIFVADTKVALGTKQGVVKEIKSNNEVRDLNGVKLFDLDEVTADSSMVSVIKNGAPATVSDIKVGDAVTYVTDGTLHSIVVSDTKVTGKITKVASDTNVNGERRKLTIDDKAYSMVKDGTVMMTKTGDVEDAEVIGSSISDFAGKDATLTLNALGQIVFVNGNIKSSATMQVGVVTKTPTENGDDYNLKIMTPSGVATSYVVSGEHFYELDSGDSTLNDSTANERDLDTIDSEIDKGDLVAYDVSADGKIKAENLFVLSNAHGSINAIDDSDMQVVYVDPNDVDSVRDSAQKIVVNGESYYVNASTVYVNSDPANIEKIDGWDSIVAGDDNSDGHSIFSDGKATEVYFVLDGEDSSTIKTLIVNTSDYESSSASYGVYVESDSDSDSDYITLFIDGEKTRYEATDSVSASIYGAGDLVKFELNGDGKIDVDAFSKRADRSDKQDLAEVAKDVYKVDEYNSSDRLVTFKTADVRTPDNDALQGSEKSVKLAKDAVVYNVDQNGTVTAATLEDIAKGKYVVVDDFDSEDDVYGVAVIFED